MPACSRIGDLDVPHCSGMVRATGSSDVFTNSRPTAIHQDDSEYDVKTTSNVLKMMPRWPQDDIKKNPR